MLAAFALGASIHQSLGLSVSRVCLCVCVSHKQATNLLTLAIREVGDELTHEMHRAAHALELPHQQQQQQQGSHNVVRSRRKSGCTWRLQALLLVLAVLLLVSMAFQWKMLNSLHRGAGEPIEHPASFLQAFNARRRGASPRGGAPSSSHGTPSASSTRALPPARIHSVAEARSLLSLRSGGRSDVAASLLHRPINSSLPTCRASNTGAVLVTDDRGRFY